MTTKTPVDIEEEGGGMEDILQVNINNIININSINNMNSVNNIINIINIININNIDHSEYQQLADLPNFQAGASSKAGSTFPRTTGDFICWLY